jgi:CTP synthase
MVIARAATPLDERRKEKIATACNILPKRVISAPDIKSIYDVPVNFEHDKLADILLEVLHVDKDTAKALAAHPVLSLPEWKKMARGIKNHEGKTLNVAIVGKYFNTGDFVLTDAYLSVLEAVKFSGYAVGMKPIIHTVNSRDFEEKEKGVRSRKRGGIAGEKSDFPYEKLDGMDGIIVPGGFGESGIEGKLNVIRYAREQGIPYFGLCYGMQLLTIEYARNVLGLEGAHTAEINPKSPHLIIDIMPDQKKKIAEGNYGGSMRLGTYVAKLTKDTIAQEAYSYFGGKKLPKPTTSIKERHRHRYEVNPKYIDRLEKAGLVFSGKSPDGTLMEIAELPRSVHPFFLGTQFHPELLARPLMPHPLFTEFMKAAKIRNKKQEAGRKEVVSDGAISVNADLIRDIEADIGDLGE